MSTSAPSNVQRFIDSLSRADQYPLNLIFTGSNNGSAKAHRSLLLENAPHLFQRRSAVTALEFPGTLCAKTSRVLSTYREDAEFAAWLVVPNANGSTLPSSTRCRFIFFKAASGQAKLNVSLAHATKVLTYFQVQPHYIDFMSVFTVHADDEQDVSDLRFSSFREAVRLNATTQSLATQPHLRLGGRAYHLSYNLKCVGNKSRESALWPAVAKPAWSWSTRQAVFHHQFDVSEGTSLWVLTSARDELQRRVLELTGQMGAGPPGASSGVELEAREEDRDFASREKSFISSLSVHLMLAQWASEDWRGYIRWLEQMLEKKTKPAIVAETYDPKPDDLLYVQIKEDITNKAAMTLDANSKVLESLDKFYLNLMKNDDFELRNDQSCKRAVADFSVQLRDFISDTKMYSERLKTLAKITADRKNLVQQHLQAKASRRVHELTIQQQAETKIMRVIAVLTLIYLPATFVSTFFSTDVVKYQDGGANGGADGADRTSTGFTSYSGLAMERWIEVTAPLTLLTVVAAVGWYYEWPVRRQGWVFWRGQETKDAEKNPTV